MQKIIWFMLLTLIIVGCNKTDQGKNGIAAAVNTVVGDNGKDRALEYLKAVQNNDLSGCEAAAENQQKLRQRVEIEFCNSAPDYKKPQCIDDFARRINKEYTMFVSHMIEEKLLPKSANIEIIDSKPDEQNPLSIWHFAKITYPNKDDAFKKPDGTIVKEGVIKIIFYKKNDNRLAIQRFDPLDMDVLSKY